MSTKPAKPKTRWDRLRFQFAALIAGQAICLIFGLWLQDRFAESVNNWSAKNAAVATDEPGSPAADPGSPNNQTLVTAISFVWICALQGVVAFMVLSASHRTHSKRQSKIDEESFRRSQDLTRTRDTIIFGLGQVGRIARPGHRTASRANLTLFNPVGVGRSPHTEISRRDHARCGAADRYQFGAA